MSVMTIFISPKAFIRDHIATIQWNAIQSWKQFGKDVDIVLIGDDPGVEEASIDLEVRYIPHVKRNSSGTPLLSDIFSLARETSISPLLAYVNADIILLPNFLEIAESILSYEKQFLLVGQRWELYFREKINMSDGWIDRIREDIKNRGRRHPAGGSDYFIFPRNCFMKMPDFAIGRSGWDNWMFYEARMRGWKLIDCSDVIDIIHQDHDYAHLPGGQPHYRQQESFENVKLAGGKRTVFTLLDCDWKMKKDGSLTRPSLTVKKILREIEIFPLVTLKSRLLGEAFFAVFHPKKAYGELRKFLTKNNMNS
jgi:hypothetical protein